MTRHGPRRLDAQAYQLRPTIPLALSSCNDAPMVTFWRDDSRMHRRTNRQDRAFPISASRQATTGALRLPHQNPKSP